MFSNRLVCKLFSCCHKATPLCIILDTKSLFGNFEKQKFYNENQRNNKHLVKSKLHHQIAFSLSDYQALYRLHLPGNLFSLGSSNFLIWGRNLKSDIGSLLTLITTLFSLFLRYDLKTVRCVSSLFVKYITSIIKN